MAYLVDSYGWVENFSHIASFLDHLCEKNKHSILVFAFVVMIIKLSMFLFMDELEVEYLV
jgi:heme/copper-type cytochrome/quinol oxidase subunit 4